MLRRRAASRQLTDMCHRQRDPRVSSRQAILGAANGKIAESAGVSRNDSPSTSNPMRSDYYDIPAGLPARASCDDHVDSAGHSPSFSRAVVRFLRWPEDLGRGLTGLLTARQPGAHAASSVLQVGRRRESKSATTQNLAQARAETVPPRQAGLSISPPVDDRDRSARIRTSSSSCRHSSPPMRASVTVPIFVPGAIRESTTTSGRSRAAVRLCSRSSADDSASSTTRAINELNCSASAERPSPPADERRHLISSSRRWPGDLERWRTPAWW